MGVFLCDSGCLQTVNPPTSASWVAGITGVHYHLVLILLDEVVITWIIFILQMKK
jgi:hypothetical protein